MSNTKQYLDYEIMYHTKCINPLNALFLRKKWYPVLDFTKSQLLIQFNNGSAKWYSLNRFEGYYNPTYQPVLHS